MQLAITLAGVAAGLIGGGFGGYRLGTVVRGSRGVYWLLNAVVVLICVALDFVGLISGRYWLSFSAIGLMAGTITGMKYGYADPMGLRKTPDQPDPSDDAAHAESEEPLDGRPEA